MSRENPGSLDFTEPLFIQHQYLASGHDASTSSATGTFLKFRSRHYVVTCGHVLASTEKTSRQTLAIMIDRSVINLSRPHGIHLISSARVPRAAVGEKDFDVAISPIPDHIWNLIVARKAKKAVDLDDWVEPQWSAITSAKACGWLDGYKEVAGGKVATQGVEVIADMASSLSPKTPQFTMFSPNCQSQDIMLSGISGGIIVAWQDEVELPIGLIFEGFPGSSDSIENRRGEAFVEPGDLMVRGHVLTPAIFAGWLSRL